MDPVAGGSAIEAGRIEFRDDNASGGFETAVDIWLSGDGSDGSDGSEEGKLKNAPDF